MKYTYFTKCRLCGANLDPDEKCTCRAEIEKYKAQIAAAVKIGKRGQLEMKVCAQ